MIGLSQGGDSLMHMNMGSATNAGGVGLDMNSRLGAASNAGHLSNGASNPNSNHSPTNLIVNYIPTLLSDEDFVKLFSSIGPVRNCKIVRDKATHQSYGFGFCDYSRPEDAKKAIETLNGLQLQNKTLRVAYARPPENGDPLSTKANVYVQNLPRTVTQSELAQYFGHYGTIVQSKILTEANSGESRGCGFVLYSRRAEAEQAISALNGQPWPGASECMLVRFALDPQQKKMKQMGGSQHFGMHGPPAPYGGGGPGFPGGAAGAFGPGNLHVLTGTSNAGGPMRSGRMNMRNAPYNRGGPPGPNMGGFPQPQGMFPGSQPYTAGAKPPRPEDTGATLYVYNIGPQCQEQTLYNLFAPYGPVVKIAIIRDPVRGCTKGYAFVTFQNYHEAANAVTALNGYTLWEKPLQVTFKQQKNQGAGGIGQQVGGQPLY